MRHGSSTRIGRNVRRMVQEDNQDKSMCVYVRDGVVLAGVCDGHGYAGGQVSTELIRYFPIAFSQALGERSGDVMLRVCELLAERVVEIDRGVDVVVREKSRAFNVMEVTRSGSTAVLAYLNELAGELTVASVGDSSYCIVDEVGRLVYSHSLTVHTAANPDELRRIAADGKDPHVLNGRIANGGLAMTRAFGDLELTGYGLSPEPDIKQFKLAPGNTVVLHTDGVNLTAEQIAELVHGNRETPCEAVAALIVAKAAEDRDNWDDITALVLRL